jgi:hypothetical protein
MAAVLACGDGAVLSHRDAAALLGIRPTAARTIDVTIPTRNGRKRRGWIRLHRARIVEEEVTVRSSIPATTLARTLLDLAAVIPVEATQRAIHEAERLRLFDLTAVEETLKRNCGRPGTGALKRALARYTEPPLTRNELERLFLRLCKKYGLPTPVVNTEVAGFEVDFRWADARLIVETDGREDHLTATAFEEDRARDAVLATLGYRVLRFSWRQVRYEPELVARSISSIL